MNASPFLPPFKSHAPPDRLPFWCSKSTMDLAQFNKSIPRWLLTWETPHGLCSLRGACRCGIMAEICDHFSWCWWPWHESLKYYSPPPLIPCLRLYMTHTHTVARPGYTYYMYTYTPQCPSSDSHFYGSMVTTQKAPCRDVFASPDLMIYQRS